MWEERRENDDDLCACNFNFFCLINEVALLEAGILEHFLNQPTVFRGLELVTPSLIFQQ